MAKAFAPEKVVARAAPARVAPPRQPAVVNQVWNGLALQRACAACAADGRTDLPVDEEMKIVQPKTSAGSGAAAPPPIDPLPSSRGDPIDPPARAYFETRLGHDFSGVRIHRGADAHNKATAFRALAFTVGRDIVFADGQYAPHSEPGRRLLAHELVHTVQQAGGGIRRVLPSRVTVSRPDDPAEREADRIADHVVRGADRPWPHVRSVPAAGISTVQRKCATCEEEEKELHVQRAPDDQAQAGADDPAIASALDNEIVAANVGASQNDDLLLRASATRLRLLLSTRTRAPLKTQADLDAFVADCKRRSTTELDTLGAYSPDGVELALATHIKGFPLTWSGRIQSALTLGVDPGTLITDWAKSFLALIAQAKTLSPDIYAHGLPVPYTELDRLDRFRLRLSDAHAKKPSAVREYARESIRYMQLKWVRLFAVSWELIVNQVAESVADGKLVPNYFDYKDFVDNKQAKLRELPVRAHDNLAKTDEEAQQIETDALKLTDVALAVGMTSALYSLFGLLSGWNDAVGPFDEALAAADASVAGSGRGERFAAALTWAWDNDYFGGAAAAWAQNLIANGPEILAELAVIVILGMIPPLDIAVAVYLVYTTARDVIGMLGELAASLNDVMQAKSVAELQKASARLATILTNGAIFILIVLATEGIGKAAARLRKGAADLRAADRTLTEEAAQKKAFEQMSAEERKALEQGKAKTSKQLAKKFEEFEGACSIGSIVCRSKLPDHILGEAGPYPTEYDVPMPGGPFNVQKAILTGTARGTEMLRSLARDSRARWPHFDKALTAAEKQGKRWPEEGGVPWEVHHIKQVNMGGGNEIENLFPLPRKAHVQYTNWWGRLRNAFERRFTKEEWDQIYWNEKDVPGSRVPKTPQR